MPATRGKNLRSGDIAEQLGLVLLQSIAVVSPVPRTEDVGIDAIATLLKDYDSHNYIAEDSFFVQIKSTSVKKIQFDKEQVSWLNSLELPFFIAHINRVNSEISLFCAHRLSNALITNYNRDKLIIHLDADSSQDYLVRKNVDDVHIGPPVLSWTLNSIFSDKDFYNNSYTILKDHIKLYKENLEVRRVGDISLITWKVNEKPKVNGYVKTDSRANGESLRISYEIMMPYFSAWSYHLLLSNDFSNADDVFELLERIKELIGKQKKREIKENNATKKSTTFSFNVKKKRNNQRKD